MSIKAETLEAHVQVTGTAKSIAELEAVDKAARGVGGGMRSMGSDSTAGSRQFDRAAATVQARMAGITRGANAQAQATARAGAGSRKLTGDVQSTGKEIDKLSGRLRVVTDLMAIVGPGAIPIATIATPALTGLAAAGGFAAVGLGAVLASTQGVSDALKAANKAAIQPTTENLEAQREAMKSLHPEARKFVRELMQFKPELVGIRNEGAKNLFPGLIEGMRAARPVLPYIKSLVGDVSAEIGHLGAETGKSLASDRWRPFLEFLRRETPEGLAKVSGSLGNTAHAASQFWMAFDPLNDNFLDWLEDATGRLDKYATRMAKTGGADDFMEYIQDVGPQVRDTLSAVANMFLQIAEAAAPLGGPVLAGLESVADTVSAIADSDMGTPIFAGLAALALYNRALGLTAALSKKAMFGGNGTSAAAGGGAAGFLNTQYGALKQLPGAYRNVKVAQESVTKAQLDARKATSAYVGQLRAVNTVTAQGFKPSMQTFNRLTDSLGRVEMANYAVREATEKARAAEAARRTTMRAGAAQMGKTVGLAGALAVASSGMADKIGLSNTVTMALMGTMAGPWGAAMGAGVGLMMDLNSAGSSFNDTMKDLNAAAGGNDLDKLNQKLKDAKTQMADINKTSGFKDFFSDIGKTKGASLLGAIPGANISSDADIAARAKAKDAQASLEAARAAQVMGTANAMASRGLLLTAAGANQAGMSVTEFKNSVLGANAAMSRQGTFDAYRQALLDAKDAAAQTAGTLTKSGNVITGQGRAVQRAGLQSRAALRGIASGAVEAASGMSNVQRRTMFLDKARNDFISLARSMGMSGPAARRAADGFGLIDQGARAASTKVRDMQAQIRALKSKQVKISESGSPQAKARVAALQRQIDALRGKTVQIIQETIFTQSNAQSNRGPAGVTSRYSSGGYTGDGGKYAPAGVVHRGEFVLDKETTARARPAIEALHASRGRALEGFTKGGPVGKGKASKGIAGAGWVNNLAESIKAGSVAGINAAAKVMEKRMSGAAEAHWKKSLGFVAKQAKLNSDLALTQARVTASRDAQVEAKWSARDAITTGITSQANVLNAGNNAGDIAASLGTQVAKAKEFAANLQEVRRRYGNAIAEQVGSAGIEGGAEVAKALVAGSASEAKSIASSFAQITSIGKSTGAQLSGQMYDAGINAANGVIAGLAKRRKAIEDYLTKVAQGMEKALKKALKIKSPSQVFDKLGQQVPNGLIRGQERRTQHVLESSRRLAAASIRGFTDMDTTTGPGSSQNPARRLTPAAMSGGSKGGDVNLTFITHNPVAEPQSRTTNKALDRAANLSLV